MSSRLFIALTVAIAGLPLVWVYDRSAAGDRGLSATATVSMKPPAPAPMTVRPLAPAAAIELNREIPFSAIPNPPARPFVYRGGSEVHQRALTCLTAAIYYEAASELEDGQRAVAQVVLNRVRHPAYPASICAVVYQGSTLPTGCQFTFTCDGSLDRARSTREWARAQSIAAAALAGSVFAPVGNALNYHANFVVPYWATSLAKKAVVGTHIFYRLPGYWGDERAFSQPYAAAEADPVTLRATALAARQRRGTRPGEPAKPLISVEADPRVELLGLVEMLASRSANADSRTPIGKDARAGFGRFSNHLAVEIYRQLAADDEQLTSRLLAQIADLPRLPSDARLTFPELTVTGRSSATGAGLAEALAAFAKDSGFAEFFAKQQPDYRSLKIASFASAMPIATKFQSYIGSVAGPIKLVVAPLVRRSFVADCYSPDGARGPLVLLIGENGLDGRSATSETARMLANAMARQAVGANGCVLPPRGDCRSKDNRLAIVADQIARQLAARAIDENTAGGKQTAKGPALAVAIGEALTSYEQNRRYFPTFSDFRPVLLQSVANSERARVVPGSRAENLKLPLSLRMARRGSDPVCDALRRGSQT
jgi:hypothetical protein